jgi:hypothetical protein
LSRTISPGSRRATQAKFHQFIPRIANGGNNMNACRLGRTLVVLVSIAIVAAMGAMANGEVIRIVSPPSTANAEGDSSVTPPRTPLRIQYLIPASDFASLPASHRYIVSFNFRADRTQTQAVDWTMPKEQIWMSTINLTSLTGAFDANHGPDKKMVFDGTFTYPFLGSGPTAGPRPFADGTRLQTPFYYDPSQGNLVVELRDFDKNYPVPASIDVATTPSANIRTLLNEGNPNGATGTLVPNVFAPMQFEFVVPEPSTFALVGLAFLYAVGSRPKRL